MIEAFLFGINQPTIAIFEHFRMFILLGGFFSWMPLIGLILTIDH